MGDMIQASVKHTLDTLITAAVQEIYLNAIYPSRLREPQSSIRGSSSETLAQHNCNVAKTQLNSIAETVDCK